MKRCRLILLFLLTALLMRGCKDKTSAPSVHLAAAASLEPVLRQLSPHIQKQLHCRLLIDSAARGTLARQILQGSPADLFISANTRWMDELARQQRIIPDSRVNLLSNRLVVVARTDLKDPPTSLEQLTHSRFAPLAMGDPAYVPAGQYAQQALQSAHLWTTIKDHATAAPDVQAALAYVLHGQCPVGIVYASDAAGVQDVRILFEVPQRLYSTIVYPAAIIAGAPSSHEATAVLLWLGGSEARAAFRQAGFVVKADSTDQGVGRTGGGP